MKPIMALLMSCFLLIGLSGCIGGDGSDAGSRSFTLTVIDLDGHKDELAITTECSTVGEALKERGLIEGKKTPYGLYVKTVNGIEADVDKAGTYWAFYIDGEYAMTAVDSTKVKDGCNYTFKVEK